MYTSSNTRRRTRITASPHQRTRSSRWTHGVEEQSHPYSPDQLNELVIDWISPSNRQLVSAHSLFLSSVAMKISIAATILALGVASAFVVDNSCHHSSVKRRIPGRAPQSFALEMSATPPSPDGKPKKKLAWGFLASSLAIKQWANQTKRMTRSHV